MLVDMPVALQSTAGTCLLSIEAVRNCPSFSWPAQSVRLAAYARARACVFVCVCMCVYACFLCNFGLHILFLISGGVEVTSSGRDQFVRRYDTVARLRIDVELQRRDCTRACFS
jgi:hypothetical protein